MPSANPRPPSPAKPVRISIFNWKGPLQLASSPFASTSKTQGKQPETRVSFFRKKSITPQTYRYPFWRELKEGGVQMIATTSKFDQLFDLPFEATMLDTQTAYQGLAKDETKYHAWVAIKKSLEKYPDDIDEAVLYGQAYFYYRAELGTALADTLPEGRHFTYADLVFANEKEGLLRETRLMVERLADNGVARERIVVSVPATRGGILAAERAKRRCDINVNLTHVSGFKHALLCIEAGASVLTFNGTELLRAYSSLKDVHTDKMQLIDHPCIKDIQKVIHYVRKHNILVEVMVTHMPGIPPLEALRGLDCLSLKGSDIENVMMPGKFLDIEPSSPHILEADMAPYPLKTFDKRTVDVFVTLTEEEQALADATVQEAWQQEKPHRNALLKWFATETLKQREIQRKPLRELIEEYESHAMVQSIMREAKANGTWDRIKHMVKDYQERTGEIGQRMVSIDWSPTALGGQERTTEAAGEKGMVQTTWTGSDIHSRSEEPDAVVNAELATSRDVQGAPEFEASRSDEHTAPAKVSEERGQDRENEKHDSVDLPENAP